MGQHKACEREIREWAASNRTVATAVEIYDSGQIEWDRVLAMAVITLAHSENQLMAEKMRAWAREQPSIRIEGRHPKAGEIIAELDRRAAECRQEWWPDANVAATSLGGYVLKNLNLIKNAIAGLPF